MVPPAIEQRLHRFPASPAWSGRRLKDVLRELVPALSSRSAGDAIRSGLVSRDGVALDTLDAVLGEGGELVVDLRQGTRGAPAKTRTSLSERIRVVHDDKWLVVVAKAPGVPVQPEPSKDEPPVVELLKHYWRSHGERSLNPILVQRLDKETSGLMVLAKDLETARALQLDLTARKIKRTYIAVVAGRMARDKGTWRSELGEDETGRRAVVGKDKGRLAVTHFKVLERRADSTLLECELETGRTHQIRIHCADAGHPVLGDKVYGPEEGAKAKARAARMMLHAVRLEFPHPETGEVMKFEVEPGGDFRA